MAVDVQGDGCAGVAHCGGYLSGRTFEPDQHGGYGQVAQIVEAGVFGEIGGEK